MPGLAGPRLPAPDAYDRRVMYLMSAAIGVLVGVLAGWLIGWRRRDGAPPPLFQAAAPVVPPVLSVAVDHLPCAAVLVGSHDEVLRVSDHPLSAALHRRDRVALRPLLDAIREVRRSGDDTEVRLRLPKRVGEAARTLDTQVRRLDAELVLVLASDPDPQERVDATRRDFIANVSHELKTPIGGISLLSEAIGEAADDPDAVRHFTRRLQEESARMSDMVNQLIDLSRLQSEDPMINATVVDVEEMVDEALGRCRQAAQSKNITVLTTGQTDMVVRGDEPKLEDAVANLVLNAVAYSDHGSRVAVTTRGVEDEDGRWVEVAVADHGIGISADNQERIFERFYRVDYGRSRAHGGTGLGLSIVRHIAEAHGGSVRVWSQLGEGSTFTLRLPEYSAADSDGEQVAGAAASPRDAADIGYQGD